MSDHDDEVPEEPIEPPPDSVPAKDSFGLDLWVHRMAIDPPDLQDPDDVFGLAAARAGVPNDRLAHALEGLEAAMVATLTPDEVDRLVYTDERVTRFLREAARSLTEPQN